MTKMPAAVFRGVSEGIVAEDVDKPFQRENEFLLANCHVFNQAGNWSHSNALIRIETAMESLEDQ